MDEQFAKVNTAVIQDNNLSHHARMLYALLCTFADFTDRSEPVFPKMDTLAGTLNISHTLVKRCLKELVTAGVIRREKRYKKSTYTYILK